MKVLSGDERVAGEVKVAPVVEGTATMLVVALDDREWKDAVCDWGVDDGVPVDRMLFVEKAAGDAETAGGVVAMETTGGVVTISPVPDVREEAEVEAAGVTLTTLRARKAARFESMRNGDCAVSTCDSWWLNFIGKTNLAPGH